MNGAEAGEHDACGVTTRRMLPMVTDVVSTLLGLPMAAEPPPRDPLPLLHAWMREAEQSGRYEDPLAMTLATATRDGCPSARIVLCKGFSPESGRLTFYTNSESRKGRDLLENPRAAAVFHWPHAGRQARIEGDVVRAEDAESDAYFATRPLISRIGACVSRQSSTIGSPADLIRPALRLAREAAFGVAIRRPASWGGFHLVALRVELWSARTGRLHHRLEWARRSAGAEWACRMLSP